MTTNKSNKPFLRSPSNAGPSGRKALGKGLGALIPGNANAKREYFECPVERIMPTPDQPRQNFDREALAELAKSIEASGFIQPLVVRAEGSRYRLIAGERRLRAARLLKLDKVPIVIKDVNEDTAFELALVENIQRQDLNPLEEAHAYKRIMDMRNYTQEELAQRLGRSRPAIANTLRLLKLDDSLKQSIISGDLSEGAARALLSLPAAEQRTSVASAASEHNLSVRQIESITRHVKQGTDVSDAIELIINPPEPTPQPQLSLSIPEPTPTPTDPTPTTTEPTTTPTPEPSSLPDPPQNQTPLPSPDPQPEPTKTATTPATATTTTPDLTATPTHIPPTSLQALCTRIHEKTPLQARLRHVQGQWTVELSSDSTETLEELLRKLL